MATFPVLAHPAAWDVAVHMGHLDSLELLLWPGSALGVTGIVIVIQ